MFICQPWLRSYVLIALGGAQPRLAAIGLQWSLGWTRCCPGTEHPKEWITRPVGITCIYLSCVFICYCVYLFTCVSVIAVYWPTRPTTPVAPPAVLSSHSRCFFRTSHVDATVMHAHLFMYLCICVYALYIRVCEQYTNLPRGSWCSGSFSSCRPVLTAWYKNHKTHFIGACWKASTHARTAITKLHFDCWCLCFLLPTAGWTCWLCCPCSVKCWAGTAVLVPIAWCRDAGLPSPSGYYLLVLFSQSQPQLHSTIFPLLSSSSLLSACDSREQWRSADFGLWELWLCQGVQSAVCACRKELWGSLHVTSLQFVSSWRPPGGPRPWGRLAEGRWLKAGGTAPSCAVLGDHLPLLERHFLVGGKKKPSE